MIRSSIIQEIKKRGLTQNELAEMSGLTQAQISNFTSGKYNLSSENIEKLLIALKMNIYSTYDCIEKKYDDNIEKILNEILDEETILQNIRDINDDGFTDDPQTNPEFTEEMERDLNALELCEQILLHINRIHSKSVICENEEVCKYQIDMFTKSQLIARLKKYLYSE